MVNDMNSTIDIALISAGAALCGVFISQISNLLFLLLNRKHQKNILLRDKYEEMMFHFTNSFNWLQQLNNCKTKDDIFSLAQSQDARKALTLCLLYFPNLVDSANTYILAQSLYYESVAKSFNGEISANAGGQAFMNNSNHQSILNNLFDAKNNFENLIVEYSKYYLKA